MDIKHATTEADLEKVFEAMKELRTQYSKEQFIEFCTRELWPRNVQFAFLEDGGRVCAAAGFRISASLAWGHFLYVDDLVTVESARSSGYGRALLDWLAEYGREQGCTEMHLDSGVQRHAAHRFYLRERMDIVFFHFRRAL